MVKRLKAMWGGWNISKPPHKPNHKPQFLWGLAGAEAQRLLLDVLPHLRVKGRQAFLLMLVWRGKSGYPLSISERSVRHTAKQLITALNNRGID